MHRHSGVLITAFLTGACGAPVEEAATPAPAPAQAAAVVAQPETSDSSRADVETLQVELAALRSQYDAQRIERDRMATQVAAHQADAEKRLAELKSRWKSVDGASRERLAEAARNEMESALMMDEEYRAQLQEADENLQRTERELREREAAALRK